MRVIDRVNVKQEEVFVLQTFHINIFSVRHMVTIPDTIHSDRDIMVIITPAKCQQVDSEKLTYGLS